MKLLLNLILLIFTINLVYSKEEFFFIRPDVRRCAAPRCGGNFLTKVNDPSGKEYHQIEMQMVDATINTELLQNFTNVIVYGELNVASIDNGQNEYYGLFLKGIYHLMQLPPQDPNPSLARVKEKFYTLSSTGCNNDYSSCSAISANLVNFDEKSIIKNNTQPYNSVPLLDFNWFNSRFYGTSATAAIVKGYILGNNLKASQVYAFTSDPHSKCPVNDSKCPVGQIPTFARFNGSRCPIFNGCTKRGVCPLVIPNCISGYTQYRLASNTTRGCPKYYCDPSFLIDPVKADNP